MRKLALLLLVSVFAVQTAEAQRRRSGNEGTRVTRTTPKRDNGFVRTRNHTRVRVVPRANRFNSGFRGSSGVYYNSRFNRPFNARGFYTPFRTHTLLFPNSNGFNTLESVEAQQEALDNLYERIRAKRLAKFLNRPSKRNKRRLVKYNILTGREADDISS